jgi:hypothetical protein
MAAHEGSEHAAHIEQRGIGDTTLEQIREDIIRLWTRRLISCPSRACRGRSRADRPAGKRATPDKSTYLPGKREDAGSVTTAGCGY